MTERKGIITFKGGPLTLVGNEVKVGDAAPDAALLANDLSPVQISSLSRQSGHPVVCAVAGYAGLRHPDAAVQSAWGRAEQGRRNPDHQHGPAVRPEAMVRGGRRRASPHPLGSPRRGVRNGLRPADQGAAIAGPGVLVLDRAGKVQYCQVGQGSHHEPDYEAALAAVEETGLRSARVSGCVETIPASSTVKAIRTFIGSRAMSTSIVWFRQDLRLADNPALLAAVERGGPVVPVYIWSPEDEGEWPPGAASRWWLHHALTALDADLRKLGSRLIIRTGRLSTRLPRWPARQKPKPSSGTIDTNRPPSRSRGRSKRSFESARRRSRCIPRQPAVRSAPDSESPGRAVPGVHALLEALPLTSGARNAPTCSIAYSPSVEVAFIAQAGRSEPAAASQLGRRHRGNVDARRSRRAPERLAGFIGHALADYTNGRDRPDLDRHFAAVTLSALGPHQPAPGLACRQTGSPSQAAEVRRDRPPLTCDSSAGASSPITCSFTSPTRRKSRFARPLPGSRGTAVTRICVPGSTGRTGYPLVDAGMRELWHTGWMHNRVRMVVASFLVKHLLVPWQEGARWFWDTLVDADLANNTLRLAVVRRLRGRCRSLLPHLQPGAARAEVRPAGQAMSAAGCLSWPGCPTR